MARRQNCVWTLSWKEKRFEENLTKKLFFKWQKYSILASFSFYVAFWCIYIYIYIYLAQMKRISLWKGTKNTTQRHNTQQPKGTNQQEAFWQKISLKKKTDVHTLWVHLACKLNLNHTQWTLFCFELQKRAAQPKREEVIFGGYHCMYIRKWCFLVLVV